MDALKLMTEKETELNDYYTRMDKDADVFALSPYEMRGVTGKKISQAYHVTMPNPKQFLEKTVAKLAGVTRQTVVEGNKMARDAAAIVEVWLDAIEHEADNLLAKKGQPPQYLQYCKNVCKYGPVVNQVLFRFKDGIFVPDVRPIIPRLFQFELDAGGLVWGSVKMKRRKNDIESDYGIIIDSADGIVRDFYDAESHIVFVDDVQVLEEINAYRKPPFNIAFPNIEIPGDTDYYKNLGDSILHNLRNQSGGYLFDDYNFIVSYLKTMSYNNLFVPVQFPSSEASDYQEKPEETPGAGQMIQVKQPAVPYPQGQLSQAMVLYIQEINAGIERGTSATLEHGIIDLPQSGVAISQKVALQNESLLPRLNCVASLYQQTAWMEIEQFNLLGESIELGERGHTRKYTSVDLDGDYTIKYRFFTTSHEQLAGATTICQAIGDMASKRYKMSEIMKFQDPDGMLVEIEMEQAALANPIIGLKQKMIAFIRAQEKSGDKDTKLIYDSAARDILAQIISIYHQRKASEDQPMRQDIESVAKIEQKGTPGIPMYSNRG